MVSATLNPDAHLPDNFPDRLPDMAQVKQFAAAGYFKAIALWINQPLVSHGIYAQVKPAPQSGCLQVVLEFKRAPKKERLIRLVCGRLRQLSSELIEGVHIMARSVGQAKLIWQCRVRLRPLQRSPQRPLSASSGRPPSLTRRSGGRRDASMIAREVTVRQPPRRRSMPQTLRRSRTAVDRQFKVIRAALLSGSVAAAFVAGCLTEVVMSRGPSLPTLPTSKDTPQNTPQTTDSLAESASGTAVSYRRTSPLRANSINAALEPVAVMPHEPVSNPNDPTVTLMFGGEVTVGNLDLSAPERVDQLFQALPAYAQADVAMVNLGNPLATAGTSLQEGYHRRTRPEAVAALKQGGIDIVGLSGDRTMDLGEQGLIETLTTLDQAGIYRVGAGRDQREARRPEVLEVKGQRIAYLSYHNQPTTTATDIQAGSNQPTPEAVIEDIAAIRGAVDWVVVNYRWVDESLGVEPTPHQVALSRQAVDAGADLVVGYHPQQLQGAEVYKGRAIVYALGDFIFADAPLSDRETAALRVSLQPQKMKVEFLPVSVRQAQPAAATGAQGEAILQKIRQASDQLDAPLNFPAVLTTRSGPTVAPTPVLDKMPVLGGELEPSDQVPAIFENSAPSHEDAGFREPGFEEPSFWNSGFEDPGFEEPGFEPPSSEDSGLGYPSFEESGFEDLGFEDLGFEREAAPGHSVPEVDSSVEPDDFQETSPGSVEGEDYLNESLPSAAPPNNPELEADRDATGNFRSGEPGLPDAEFTGEELTGDELTGDEFIDSVESDEPTLERMPTPTEAVPQPMLDGWGPKTSPHEKFQPIRNSQPTDPADGTVDVSPTHPIGAPSIPPAAVDTGAIGPYSEPLVGPLSQQPSFLTPVDKTTHKTSVETTFPIATHLAAGNES